MDKLHDDILTEILLRVPARSLARLKWTNKRWHTLISRPTFVKLHLESSRKDPESQKILKIDSDDYSFRRHHDARPVKFFCIDSENHERENRLHVPTSSFPPITWASIEGTCDGLVCIVLSADCGDKSCRACDGIICLWNPCTGELRELPNLQNYFSVTNTYGPAFRVGLGYDFVADDYKAVALTSWGKGMNPVHICARNTSTWKRVADTPGADIVNHCSFYWKGAVHWVAHRSLPKAVTSEVILSFDFAKEEFQERPVPKHITTSIWVSSKIGTLDGCLCVYTRPGVDTVEVYGVETWARIFSISTETIPTGLVLAGSLQLLTLRNGKILVLRCKSAFLYDLEDETLRHIPFRDDPQGCCWFRVYEESLVSPYSRVDGCKCEEVVTSPSCRGSRTLGR